MTRSGKWTKLNWDKVAASAADRVYHPEHIDQDVLGLCGPAAAVEYDAATNASHYAQEVIDVFEQGKAAGKTINSTLLGSSPPSSTDPCDWMLLSAIQDVTNLIGKYFGTQAENTEFFGAGLSVGQQKDVLRNFSGAVQTTEYSCSVYGVYDQSMKVMDLINKYGNDVVVVMEVDSTTLRDENKRGSNDHFVRLLKLRGYNDVEVKFDIFTWASIRSLTFKTENFEHMVDGYIVGARRQDISL